MAGTTAPQPEVDMRLNLVKFVFAAIASVPLSVSFSADAHSQAALVDSYCTQISEKDKAASDGFRLTDAASIIRQDRANYHRFDRRDADDEGDTVFASAAARQSIPAMLKSGHIEPSIVDEIVQGTPRICVDVYGAQWIEVFLAADHQPQSPADTAGADYPFVGVWDCEVAEMTFTPTLYNNGSEDLPIREIQEGSDGSYTLLFDGDYFITLSGIRDDRMGWYSSSSGDNFSCRRIN
jgi:hypothetical protein